MARAPQPVAAEVAVEEPVAPGAGADMAAEDVAVETSEEPVVVATILKAADGSFILETGEEPEMPGMEMAEPGAMPMAAEGKTFPADEAGVGALMTAILDIVDPENAEGPAAAANFKAGFSGEEDAPQPAA